MMYTEFLNNTKPKKEFSTYEKLPSYSGSNFHVKRISETEVIAYGSNSKPIQYSLPDNNQYFASVILLTMIAIVVLAGSCRLFIQIQSWMIKEKVEEAKFKIYLNKIKSFPCYDCTYFSDNVYIKCAVNPDDVLTSNSHFCNDYCPRQS